MYKQTIYRTTARDINALISDLLSIQDDFDGSRILIDNIDFRAEELKNTTVNHITITVREA